MTWRWDILDIPLRVTIGRSQSPSDFLTVATRLFITSITSVLGVVLKPVDYVARLIGHLFIMLVITFMILALLDIIWIGIWWLLITSSRLWLEAPWTRPFLVIPGTILAIIAHTYYMLAPDPHKVTEYASIPQEWPLTWFIWKPPSAYFEHPDSMYKPL